MTIYDNAFIFYLLWSITYQTTYNQGKYSNNYIDIFDENKTRATFFIEIRVHYLLPVKVLLYSRFLALHFTILNKYFSFTN